jgi:hypothetical protein
MRMTIFRSSRLAVVLVGALSAPTVAQGPDTVVTARTLAHATAPRRVPAHVGPLESAAVVAGVRLGEYLTAPFVESVGGPRNVGRIVGTGDVPGIPLTEANRHLLLRERIFVVPPVGRSASVGDRYVSFVRGRVIPGIGEVIVPTGVVAIDRADAGQAAEASVLAVYGDILVSQGLMPLELHLPDSLAQLQPVANGAESKVVWVSSGDPALPTIQNYVIVDAGSARGLREGDQLSFIRPRRHTTDGVTLPESEIALARVVRVSQGAATAIVLRQAFPAISIGTLTRVTARLP